MHEYVLALIGGGMIGLAAVMLMATHGRILGVSGIIGGLLPPPASDWSWRVTFIAGVLTAPLLYSLIMRELPVIEMTGYWPLLLLAGFLVGVGTVLGSGCTSGHGVCGLPRLSHRSLVATAVFILFGGLTVYVLRHILGGGL